MEHRSARKLDWSAWGHTTVVSHEPSRSRRRKGMWREALLRRMLALADSTEALGPVLSLGSPTLRYRPEHRFRLAAWDHRGPCKSSVVVT